MTNCLLQRVKNPLYAGYNYVSNSSEMGFYSSTPRHIPTIEILIRVVYDVFILMTRAAKRPAPALISKIPLIMEIVPTNRLQI